MGVLGWIIAVVLGIISYRLKIKNSQLITEREVCSISCDLNVQKIKNLENQLEEMSDKFLNSIDVSAEVVEAPKRKRKSSK